MNFKVIVPEEPKKVPEHVHGFNAFNHNVHTLTSLQMRKLSMYYGPVDICSCGIVRLPGMGVNGSALYYARNGSKTSA